MNNYEQIAEHDYALFGNLIHQARGKTALDKFAMKCGYTNRVFQGYVRQEKNQMRKEESLHKIIDPIAQNADPESGITEESLFAAMGYIPKRYVMAVYHHYQKEVCKSSISQKGYDFSTLYDSLEEKMTEQDQKDERFVEFLDDFSFFAATLSKKFIYEIKKRMYKIYAEETLVRMLHEFHVSAKTFDQSSREKIIFYLKDEAEKPDIQISLDLIQLHAVLKDLLTDF